MEINLGEGSRRESRLARKGKGKEAKLCYSGHVLMENRHGLCVDLRIAEASGHAERDEAMEMLRRLRRRGYDPRTLAGDKGYDAGSFPHEVLALGIEPHIAVNRACFTRFTGAQLRRSRRVRS